MTTTGQMLRKRLRPKKRRHYGRKRRDGLIPPAAGAKDSSRPLSERGKAESETDSSGRCQELSNATAGPFNQSTCGEPKNATGVDGRTF